MIIREIHIDGFGVFSDYSLTGLDQGVNILLGNNEAGKSTLLAFLRYTLFGYPDPRRKINQYPPLNGGQHGGRIKATLHSGTDVAFERHAGSKGGQIKLLYNGQETGNTSQWSQLLGNASEELYNNVYAFSLDELVHLDSLSKSGVEDKIFSVGLGLGNISIGEVESSIRETIDKIYKQKGKNQLIPQILSEIRDKKDQIRSIQENLPLYQTLNLKITKLEEETNTLDSQVKELNGERNQLNNYLKCYPYFIILTRADEALKNLPGLQDYPENGVEQLDRLEEKEQGLSEAIGELKNGTKDEKGPGELQKKMDSISFNSQLLEKEDQVDYLRKNLEKYKDSVKEKRAEEQKAREIDQSVKAGIADISGSWTERDIAAFTGLVVHRNRIEGYKSEMERLVEEKRDLDARIKASRERESPVNIKAIAVILSIILFIGSIPAFINASYVLAAALVVMALLLFFGRKYVVKEGGYDFLQGQWDDLKESEQKTEKEYTQYLEDQLNLTGSLSPAAVLEILRQIEQLKKEIDARDELKNKIDKQRAPFIDEFESTASALQNLLTGEAQGDNTEMMVGRIVEELDQARKQLQHKRNLEEEINRKRKALNDTQSKLEQTRENINELLNSVKAQDRNDFRKKYKDNEEVKERLKKKNDAIEAIENIVGHNKADEVTAYLQNHEKPDIEERVRELTGEIDSKQQEWKEKNSALGGTRNEIERIEGESELAEALTELETARQKLQDAYKEWMTGKIALDTLNEVKSKYEQEKQPAVIQNSSRYFHRITGGTYENIRVSLDDQDVAVYDQRGASKKIEHLSRGTREQLLISLRLGFIEEYEKQAEPLPLIVDEVMVNFDPQRAGQTAEIMQAFGQNRQVFVFTCHPNTIEFFDRSSVRLTQL